MIGKELEELTYIELHDLEQQLTEGLLSVKDRKVCVQSYHLFRIRIHAKY